jgi:hypothetical protein
MVDVPRSSIDPVKVITEHDLLKWVGTALTMLIVPLMFWVVTSQSSRLDRLAEGLNQLHEQVAVLQVKLKVHSELTTAEFDATKSQIRAVGDKVQGLREDAGKLLQVVSIKAAKGKRP